MDRKEENRKLEAKYREAMEECATFMAKMIEKYGDEAVEELKGKESKAN